MHLPRTNTAYLLAATAAIALACLIHRPPLPLRAETKLSWGYHLDSLLNFTQLAGRYGYAAEEHRVTTEDGYILTLFRIASASCSRGGGGGGVRGRPVLLMHGLLQSADAWLDAGPGHALGYLLADGCHDLWVGNQRGNYYARAHATLDPEEPRFWQFAADEIGLYDVPATVDYVLNATRADRVNYIGYSQGAMAFLIMCSERPEYCGKVGVAIGLAPAARMTHTRSATYRALLRSVHALRPVLSALGVQELFAKGSLGQELAALACQVPLAGEHLCGRFEAVLDGRHAGSISAATARALFGHFPAGTSVQNLARYGHSAGSRRFAKFDHGPEGNALRYGAPRPPEYNLTAVAAPFVALYGRGDLMVDARDVRWLLRRLPRVLAAVEVDDPLWNHFDVPYSRHTKDLVYPHINHYLHKYSGI